MAESAYEWVARFAEELGTTAPDKSEFNALLGLASIAAHASERTAAPVSCWVAAKAGIPPAEAMAVARRLKREGAGEEAGDSSSGPAAAGDSPSAPADAG